MLLFSSGLEILSTSYAGAPREPPLRGEPLGHVRNIRVKISNHFYDSKSSIYFIIIIISEGQVSPRFSCIAQSWFLRGI